jgi:hypothetical protein
MHLSNRHVALLVAIATGKKRSLRKYANEAIDFAEAVLGMKFGTGHLRERICLAVVGAKADSGQHGYDGWFRGRPVEVKTEQIDEGGKKKIAGCAKFTTATNELMRKKLRDNPRMLHGAFVGPRLAALFMYDLGSITAKAHLLKARYGSKKYSAQDWPARVTVVYKDPELYNAENFSSIMLEKLGEC